MAGIHPGLLMGVVLPRHLSDLGFTFGNYRSLCELAVTTPSLSAGWRVGIPSVDYFILVTQPRVIQTCQPLTLVWHP